MATKKETGKKGRKIGRNKIKGQTYRGRDTRAKNKSRRIAKDAARKSPRSGCGHAKRYQGKLGCSKCRRESGATMHAPPKGSMVVNAKIAGKQS